MVSPVPDMLANWLCLKIMLQFCLWSVVKRFEGRRWELWIEKAARANKQAVHLYVLENDMICHTTHTSPYVYKTILTRHEYLIQHGWASWFTYLERKREKFIKIKRVSRTCKNRQCQILMKTIYIIYCLVVLNLLPYSTWISCASYILDSVNPKTKGKKELTLNSFIIIFSLRTHVLF